MTTLPNYDKNAASTTPLARKGSSRQQNENPPNGSDRLKISRGAVDLENMPMAKSISELLGANADPNVSLRKYHKRFTPFTTILFVWKSSATTLVFFIPWVIFCTCLDYLYTEYAAWLSSTFLVKALTMLVGILIALYIRESVDKYRECLARVVDFRDDFRTFWYMVQTQTVDQRAARFIVDFHMVAFAISVIRYMHRKYGVDENRVFDLVQEELKGCVLFQRSGPYAQYFANPIHAEFLLISWLRVISMMDRDIRLRWEILRKKLHVLLTRVRIPATAKHLLWAVLMVFLFMTPICSPSLATKLSTPLICMVLCSLLQLSEELEDPFGEDEHDLPLCEILTCVTRIHVEPHMQNFLAETLDLFNNACTSGHWNMQQVQHLFGEDQAILDPESAKLDYDSGVLTLSRYMTLPDLERLDVVGYTSSDDPDVLFSKKMN